MSHIPFRCAVLLACIARAATAQQPSDTTKHADSSAVDSTRHVNLETVTVVAAPAAPLAPRAAVHLTAAAMQSVPAATPYDMLRQAAGLEVHEQGQGPGFASDASLRGFSSDHATDLAMWIDGVPVNEPVNGHAEGYDDWSVLFPAAVSDLDVIRGPTSPMFGNFALAGVVNVRTIERMQGAAGGLQVGSFGTLDGWGMAGADRPAFGGVVGVHGSHGDGFRPNSTFDLGQLHARGVHALSQAFTLDEGLEVLDSRWRSPGYLSEDEFANGNDQIVSNATDGGDKRRVQLRASTRLVTSHGLWRTTAYGTAGAWRLFLTIPPEGGVFEGSGSQSEEDDHRTGVGLTSAMTWELDRGTFTLAGESRWDRTRYQNYFTTDRSRDSVAALLRASQASGAIIFEGTFDLASRVHVDAGGRVDELSTRSTPDGNAAVDASAGIVSPKAGVAVDASAHVQFYGTVARGFRMPNGLVNDPALAPILAWSTEAGVRRHGTALDASLAAFRVNVSNEQTIDPVSLAITNGGRSRRQGVELSWAARASSLVAVHGNWTFLDAHYLRLSAAPEGGGSPDVLDGARVYNTARYAGDTWLELATPSFRWRAHVGGNWVGPYSPFDEPRVVTVGYGLAHASLVGTVRNATIQLGVRNVLDRRYPELIAAHLVAPGEPRMFQVTVKLASTQSP